MFFSISASFVGFPIQQYLDGGLKKFCFFCYLVNLSQFDLRIFFLNGLKSPTRSPSYFPLHAWTLLLRGLLLAVLWMPLSLVRRLKSLGWQLGKLAIHPEGCRTPVINTAGETIYCLLVQRHFQYFSKFLMFQSVMRWVSCQKPNFAWFFDIKRFKCMAKPPKKPRHFSTLNLLADLCILLGLMDPWVRKKDVARFCCKKLLRWSVEARFATKHEWYHVEIRKFEGLFLMLRRPKHILPTVNNSICYIYIFS